MLYACMRTCVYVQYITGIRDSIEGICLPMNESQVIGREAT